MMSAADDVDLMRRAPHTRHVEFYATCDARDDTSASPGHGVPAIGRNAKQFAAPVWVERVQKFNEQVEDHLHRVAIEHRNPKQMDVAKPTLKQNRTENVEERLITLHA